MVHFYFIRWYFLLIYNQKVQECDATDASFMYNFLAHNFLTEYCMLPLLFRVPQLYLTPQVAQAKIEFRNW